MAQIDVVFLGPEDYPQVLRIFRQLHKTHSDLRPDYYLATDVPITQDGYIELFKKPENHVLGAMDGTQLAGMCILKWRSSKNPLVIRRKIAYLDDICVDEQYRQRGIGELLCQRALQIAKEEGADGAELGVWNCNHPAMRLYQKLGFIPRVTYMELTLK